MALTHATMLSLDRLRSAISFEDLRSINPRHLGEEITLLSHQEGKLAGGGVFVAVQGTATDDGGYTCVPTDQQGMYWRRVITTPGVVNCADFGLYDGGVLDGPLTLAINYCIRNSCNRLIVPALGMLGYTLYGDLEFTNSTNGLVIEGPGMCTKGTSPIINHTGNNIGITFKRASQAQSLFNTVVLKDFTVAGTADGIAFVRFSDFYGASVMDSVIRDYTTGTAIDVYNDLGWTEVFRVSNVMVRTSMKGLWFHSNPESTDRQTLSFFGALIENFGFQHGIREASYGIYVGDGKRADNLYNCKIDMTGWWEQGGNSTALYVRNKAIVDGKITFRYDGFAASPMTSGTQPCRLIRKDGTDGYVKLDCDNYKHLAGIPIASGEGTVTVRPWLALAESLSNIATPHPSLPGESIIQAKGLKCKLTGTLTKGKDVVVQVRSLPAWHRYKVTLRSNMSSTGQQQYVVNIPNDNNSGVTVRSDCISEAKTTTNTKTTIDGSAGTAASVSTSNTTLSNKVYEPMYLRNAGGLADNTYSTDARRGFDLVLKGTSGAVSAESNPFSMEIEAID